MARALKIILLIFVLILAVGFIVYKISCQDQLTVNISKALQEKRIEDPSKTNKQWLHNQKKLHQLTSIEINSILKEVQRRFPDKDERLKALSILRLDTPYQFGCLGEESAKDKDPIFRLDVTDCTAFVLTNVALLHSQRLEEAEEMMKFLNYRPEKNLKTGEIEYKITFENRLHFTTDRNISSPYFQDITEQVAGPSRIKKKKVILNKIKADGERLINIDWEKEIVMKYIPNGYITKELLSGLPEAIGIAFIKEGDEEIGLDVRHEGLLFDGSILFHASSTQKKVVTVDFLNYYFGEDGNPRFDGVILFEIK